MMTITDSLVVEHRVLLTVLDQVERLLPQVQTLAEFKRLTSLIEGLLRDHAATEAEIAYAALDHALHEKGRLDQMHQDHQEIDARLIRVQAAKALARARPILAEALRATRSHFQCEEETVFPLMARVLSAEALRELGTARAPGTQAATRTRRTDLSPVLKGRSPVLS